MSSGAGMTGAGKFSTVSVLDQTEAVQILCRRVLDLERRLAALTEASA